MTNKPDNEKHIVVMVLDDGETFSAIPGCTIRVVTPEDLDAVDSGEVKINEVGIQTALAVANTGNTWYWDHA